MNNNNNIEFLLEQIKNLSELFRDGRYNQIDLSALGKENADTAQNFKEVIENLENAAELLIQDSYDLPKINDHLSHISDTTENGVLKVINTSESIMDDTSQIQESLDTILKQFDDNAFLQDKLMGIANITDGIQNKCFSIITAVEFEDINRQLMGRILTRLKELLENLSNILLLLNLTDRIHKRNSTFIESLKHILDIEGANRQSQDMIDELFEDFK